MSLKRSLALGLPAALIGVALIASAAPDAKKLGKNLDSAVALQDPGKVQAALAALIQHGGEDALKPVLANVQKTFGKGSMSIYWQLVSGGAGFRDSGALKHLGDFILKKKKAPFARDLLFGLENNSSPHAIECLSKVLSDKKAYDLQLMAADQLAQIHTVPSVNALMKQLKAEGDKGDPDLRRRLMSALATITGEQLGEVAANWLDWWDVKKNTWQPKGSGGEGDGDEGMGGGGGHEGGLTSTMNRDRKEGLESLQRGPNRILVISSVLPKDYPKKVVQGKSYDYDHMEQILERMEIPHKVVLKADFEKEPEKYLKDAWTILVNCNNIQTQCVCENCGKIMAEKQAKGASLGAKNNRLYTCPSECGTHDQVSFRMTKETVDKLKKWVEGGGYLFTEDWGLIEIIEVAWPKMVSSDSTTDAGGKSQAAKVTAMDVKIMPGKGMTSRPILRGVFTKPRPPARKTSEDGGTNVRDLPIDPTLPPSHSWKIDDESPSVKVVSKDVDVLMRSEDLGKAMDGKDAVAVSFRAGKAKPAALAKRKKARKGPVTGGGALKGKSRGKSHWRELQPGGRVLHVMSHFGKQQGSSEDTFVLQNMILNFIMESNRQHGE